MNATTEVGTGSVPDGVRILPVLGIGEVHPGDDLAALITTAAPWLADGDILVVTSKIVSKAEGRLVEVPADGPEREQARAEAITSETARVVATRGGTRIVATHHGFVMAAAGVDASNVEISRLVLLPKDPDGSARALRATLARRYGLRVAVIVSDTMGRPWRNGLTDVALGAAGIAPLHDHRGGTDRYGNPLTLTQMAIVDELAGAGELVKGKTDGVPVAVVRGLPLPDDADGPGVVASLVRPVAEDLFALGAAEARAAGLRAAATLPVQDPAPATGSDPVAPQADHEPMLQAAVGRAVATVSGLLATGTGVRYAPGRSPVVECTAPQPVDPLGLVRFGGDLHRLRAALAAERVDSALEHTADPGAVRLRLTITGP